MTRALIIVAILLAGCAAPPPPQPDYRSAPGYLPAYPQYDRPPTARDTVVLGQGGVAICH